jgi:hypothetical protein
VPLFGITGKNKTENETERE